MIECIIGSFIGSVLGFGLIFGIAYCLESKKYKKELSDIQSLIDELTTFKIKLEDVI